MTYDAVVIGGGPAGATAALLLARAGWSVALIERKAFPRRKVCGEYISATSLPLLDVLGVGEAFRRRAGPEVRRVGFFAGDAVLSAALPQADGRWGQALGRETLDLLLRDAAAAAGAAVWQPWRATALDRDGAGFRCTIQSDVAARVLAAPVAIAAYGSWERGVAGPEPVPHRPSDLLAFKAHFDGADLSPGLMPLIAFPGGYGGMVHTDGGRVSLSCCIRRDALSAARRCRPVAHAGDSVLAHISHACRGVREALAGATLDGSWLSAGPMRPGFRPCRAGGVFRVGNLAGEAHPIVAEGISMAIQSAWLLSGALIARQSEARAGQAHDAIAAAYEAQWRRLFGTRVRAAAVFANLAMRPNAVALGAPLLRRFPGLLTFGAQLSGKAAALPEAA